MDPDTLSAFLDAWGYPALLLLLLLTGVGSPIPEDLLLLTAGYLVFSKVFGGPATLLICLVGVVVSDVMLYAAGRHLAWHSERWTDGLVISHERLQRSTRWFDRIGDPLVFVARLVPGTRALVFLTAGARGVPIWRFIRYDVLGACLWVPAMLWIGYAFGTRIGDVQTVIEWLAHRAVWAIVIAGILLMVWFSWGREESKL